MLQNDPLIGWNFSGYHVNRGTIIVLISQSLSMVEMMAF